MPKKPVAQESQRGDHRRADPYNIDQLDEINVVFMGSMSIALKTQGYNLEREISSIQRIKPRRRMKWSKTNILFNPKTIHG
jgi:hypothetical protein